MLLAIFVQDCAHRLAGSVVSASIVGLALLGAWPDAVANHTLEKDGYSFSIQVVPRIGAFNRLIYEEAFDGKCAARPTVTRGYKGWNAYWGSIEPVLQQSFKKATKSHVYPNTTEAPVLDLIATRTSFDGNLNLSTNCGYGLRRVFLSLKAPAGRTVKCDFTLPGKPSLKVAPRGQCGAYVTLDTNLAQTVQATVTDPAGKVPPVTLRETIPEDFLIVSLGDSYASGEGNPDASKGFWADVKWMDPWCHRSAFAAPIQAGLLLMEDPSRIQNPRVRRAIKAGAITIVSFACSGARVSAGLNGNYDGVRGWDDFGRQYVPDIYALASKTALRSPEMERQLIQLKNLIQTQAPSSRGEKKLMVDALLLSGGGNDAGFAAIVKKILLGNVGAAEKQTRIDKALKSHFENLATEYSNFASNLRGLEATDGKRIEFGGILATLYPDPSYSTPKQDCGDNDERGLIEKALAKGAALFHLFEISGSEIGFIRESVLKPLNAAVGQASKGEWLTLPLQQFGTMDVRNHGWCRTGGGGYKEQDRWFRKFQDSEGTQGNENGSYHPTWQFNRELAAGIIADAVAASLSAEPRWDDITLAPRTRDTGFISPIPRFSYDSRPDEIRIEVFRNGDSVVPICRDGDKSCKSSSIGVHGEIVDIWGRGSHVKLKRRYTGDAVLKGARIDALPPEITCEVRTQAAEGGEWIACGSAWTSGTVRLTASDNDSGVFYLDAKVLRDATLLSGIEPKLEETPKQHRKTLQIGMDGTFEVGACADDRVGNRTGSAGNCTQQFQVRVDATEPEIRRLDVYGTDWRRAANARPVIPIFQGVALPQAALVVLDVTSGLRDCAPGAAPNTPASCALTLTAIDHDEPGALWKTQEFEQAVRDNAGNRTRLPYATVIVPEYQAGVKPLDAATWRTRLAAGDSEALRALEAVRLIAPELPAPDGPLFAISDIHAAWLNMATGRIRPDRTIKNPGLVATCEATQAAGSATAMHVLRLLGTCVASPPTLGKPPADYSAIMRKSGFLPSS